MISCARNTTSTACSNASTSSSPSSRRNFKRFSEARLQAESSIDMYSEHGLDALIRPVFGSVCHLLIVVSYCTPGSAERHDASAIWRSSSLALTVSTTAPSVRAVRFQSASFSTASMNASVTRTELFAFWYWIEAQSPESSDMSYPAASRTRAFSSSLALHQMNSSTSGWSTSRTTILAARRVLPPDLIVPAEASAPRMKLTGPEASPPLESCSCEERSLERLMPEPEPPRKTMPSRRIQSRIDSIESSIERMKHAEHCGFSSNPTLNQTGELKAAYWLTRIAVSSASNVSASSSVAKYPPSRPQLPIVSTTRPTICFTLRSRSGEVMRPRKYFCATMFVAVCDQNFGNSTPFCSKTGLSFPGV